VTRSLAPLRHRSFRCLVAGQFASNLGDACYAVALPWYVLAEHGGPLLLGTVLAAYGVPRTAALAFGGHASDRWRPWTVMMGSDVVRAICTAALATAAALGPARTVILVPIAVVLGAGEGLFLPGSFAIVPTLLPDADLQAGNALTSGGTQLATLAGPALGGALVALAGPAPAFAFDAASFVVSAVTLAGVRSAQVRAPVGLGTPVAPAGPVSPAAPVPAPVPAGEPGAPAPTLRGLLRSQRVLQLMLLVTVAANLGSGGLDGVAIPSLAHGPLHTSAAGYGALIAAFAAGALLGTVAAGQGRRARRPAIVGSAAYLAEALFLAVVPYLGGVVLVGAALAATGVMNGFGNVVMITVFQRWAPPDLLGRLTGLLLLASFGVFPVSVALGALVVHDLGPAPFFPIAAAALAAAILLGLSQRSWRQLGTIGAAGRTPVSQPGPAPAAADGAIRLPCVTFSLCDAGGVWPGHPARPERPRRTRPRRGRRAAPPGHPRPRATPGRARCRTRPGRPRADLPPHRRTCTRTR
jgi:predicted MFS family arabinose efflux permease